MKLQDEGNKVEEGGSAILQDLQMKIRDEDQHVVIGIIRHKMYSNAIRTIIQEVGCNARDAHREHGCSDVPVEIKLPDRHDNSFYIKDFGVGVDPDRMANVFVNYGASTKRDTDGQTGGFGLGAKSPFAYSDQFGIVTVTPDSNGVMILRQYMAIIEGQNSYVKQVEERKAKSDEQRGTKIIIPVKPEDFENFRKWTLDRCRHWKVKPNVISAGNPVVWPDDKVEFSGEDGTWEVLAHKNNGYSYNRNTEDNKPQAVVDGVPYPISRSSVERSGHKSDNEINKLWGFPVLLHFNTGEVSMTATREELDYTVDITAKAIRNRFESIVKELKDKLNDNIANCKTFIEANTEWNKIKQNYGSIVSKVNWNGHDISGFGYKDEGACKINHFTPDSTKSTGYRRQIVNRISFEENMKVVLDLTEKTGTPVGKIGGLFDSDTDLRHIFVVKPKKPEDIYGGHAIHKTKTDWLKTAKISDVWDWLKDETDIDLYDGVDVESLPKRKPKKRGAKTKVDTAKVMREFTYGSWRSPEWAKTTLDYEEDSGYLVYLKNRDAYSDVGFQRIIGNHLIKEFCEVMDVTVHGVLSRHAKKVGKGWTPITDHIKSEYKKAKKEIDKMVVPDSFHPYSTSDVKTNVVDFYAKLPKDSELVKMVEAWKTSDKEIINYQAKAVKYNKMVEFMRKIDHQNRSDYIEIDFNSQKNSINYAKKIEKRYPFLLFMESWYCKVTNSGKIEYVKAMDEFHGPVV